nr:APC family permease [uncultured Holophaga sp.]
MFNIRRVLLGPRLSSDATDEARLGKFVGLAVFSSDALSSVAYATQEIMAALSASGMALGAAGVTWLYGLSVPVALGIVGLLAILGTGYRQTIMAYPGGGGAYIVAKENLSERAAQTAGAALLTDYILTVAVSVSGGVAAMSSALPALQGYNVLLTILAIVLIAGANLRGVRESGSFFAIPTYLFVFCMGLLVLSGFWCWFRGASPPVPAPAELQHQLDHAQMLSGAALVWIFMRAYSAGCTALTGVEAISNGVTAFREPAARNASRTMIWMILLLGSLFLSITLLSHHFGVTYHHSTDPAVVSETLLSKLAKAIYGDVHQGLARIVYLATQISTFAILVVAANTAYAGFPRLAALQARDGFLPKQFAIQGDRLVFSNGIIILTVLASFLVWLLDANTDLLLPLYALGVFIGFTLCQLGMVVHWLRLRNKAPHWHTKAFINGVGALVSGIVMLDIGLTKFVHGAWIVVLLIPLMVHIFFRVHRHYISIKARLAVSRLEAFLPPKHHALVLVSGLHGGVVEALAYARLIAGDRVEALTVDLGSDGLCESPALERLRSDWTHYGMGVPLRSVPSPYRRIVEPILEEVVRFRQAEPDVCLTVILPEFVTHTWWERLLHGQMAFRIKAGLMMKPGVIVTSVRIHLPK